MNDEHELDRIKGWAIVLILGACFWVLVLGVITYLW